MLMIIIAGYFFILNLNCLILNLNCHPLTTICLYLLFLIILEPKFIFYIYSKQHFCFIFFKISV